MHSNEGIKQLAINDPLAENAKRYLKGESGFSIIAKQV